VEAPGTYGDGMSTVNYIDVEFERRGGDPENGLESTETIQPFVQDICEVSHWGCRRASATLPRMCLSSRAVLRDRAQLCEQIEAKYGFQPSRSVVLRCASLALLQSKSLK
jgi:hypothetical protein